MITDINGKAIKEGLFVKITGCKVKNDNGIYVVDKQYDGRDDFCLYKVLITGELSKTKYNIFFLNKTSLARNENIKVEVIAKDGLKRAGAEVKAYVTDITAGEKVLTFIPGNEQSQYIKIIKPIHFTSRIYGLTGTYAIERRNGERISFHLIGARGEKVSCNMNNRYKGSDIIFSLKTDAFNKLVGEGHIAFLDRIESYKGEGTAVRQQ